MAQPSNRIVTSDMLDQADYRDQFIEMATAPDDFASGESSLVISTVPFLPGGRSFTDIPMYPVGLAQSFAYNEGLSGQMIPEIGSSRKISTTGSAMGSGSIAKLLVHGNSLAACLYRPTLAFIQSTESLSGLQSKLLGPDADVSWIPGLLSKNADIYSAELTDYIDVVVATGGLNSLLFKIPFGLIEVKRDMRQRVIAINYIEQCSIRGSQSGLSAGQFQLVDQLSFEFERVRPMEAMGPFSLSGDTAVGV